MSDEPRNDELDSLRIRRLAAVRRATYRARSHCVTGGIISSVLAIQMTWSALTRLTRGSIDRTSITYVVFAAGSALAAILFLRRARRLEREATESDLSDPAAPPDFSTLSDGSQRWKDLENIE